MATPGALVPDTNLGFVLATPVGVELGSPFALRSTLEVSGDRAVREARTARRVRLVLVAIMGGWAVVSLAKLSAFVLLAEAILTMALARSCHLSWWEWHLLLLGAYGLVAYGAKVGWREERFNDLYLEQTRAGRRQVSVLFADLQGFTPYSEGHPPDEVSRMLNEYFAVAVPAVTSAPLAGEVHQIIGDALMVVFNRRGDQPDHAARAAAAGLALQQVTGDPARDQGTAARCGHHVPGPARAQGQGRAGGGPPAPVASRPSVTGLGDPEARAGCCWPV